jgi:hypothetical protein
MINFYQATVERYIEIDEDECGLFCTVPSEKDMDVRYRLACVESATGVEVLSCSCPSRKPDCKHMAVAQAFWARIYKSNAEKAAEVVEVERAQVWDKDLCCLIYADSREIVDPAAHEREIAAQRATWKRESEFPPRRKSA